MTDNTRPRAEMKPRDRVYEAIDSERAWQDRKWGTPAQHPHEVGGYLTLMRNILQQADAAWSGRNGDAVALDEIRKLAAVAVACGEQHGMPYRSPTQTMDRMRNV